MSKKINYAEKIVNKFGGQSSLAKIMDKRQSTIQHWVESGRIPAQWHQPLMKLAHDKGVALEAKDFVSSEIPAVEPATGKLGVLCVGLGAVTSTLIAGVEHVRRGSGKPFGSVTQMATIRLGKRTDNNSPLIRDFVPLAKLEQLVFGAWDPIPDDCYEAAVKCEVLDRTKHIEPVADYLKSIKPMPAVFDPKFCKRIKGNNVKKAKTKFDLVEALREDIRRFKTKNKCARIVMIWLASTEKFVTKADIHDDLNSFIKALKNNDERIAPSQMYAYAAMLEGVPFANGAPGLTVDIPFIEKMAKDNGIPIAGKDMKTGQTLVKTVIAPMLKARMLGLDGWFSTNILGNRDGEVLDEPENFKTKEESKLGSLEYIFQPELYPDLYKDAFHKVRIEYYPPRGDAKEGWDNIDIFGWLGKRMQLKINFLCSDSTLAAPVALDIILFMDLAKRAGLGGIQEWLSFYFKSPHHSPLVNPEHDLFIQQTKLKNTLRWMMGEEQITHLGMEYYLEE
jgi:myo-inositol-1-phosphate synthase